MINIVQKSSYIVCIVHTYVDLLVGAHISGAAVLFRLVLTLILVMVT